MPPSAPVETVFMHGVLDRVDGPRIPNIIRCHERYLQDERLGFDREGCLNYLGDPQVSKFQLSFVSNEAIARPGTMPAGSSPVEAKPFEAWPCPCPVDLSIVPAKRKRAFFAISDLGKLCGVNLPQ